MNGGSVSRASPGNPSLSRKRLAAVQERSARLECAPHDADGRTRIRGGDERRDVILNDNDNNKAAKRHRNDSPSARREDALVEPTPKGDRVDRDDGKEARHVAKLDDIVCGAHAGEASAIVEALSHPVKSVALTAYDAVDRLARPCISSECGDGDDDGECVCGRCVRDSIQALRFFVRVALTADFAVPCDEDLLRKALLHDRIDIVDCLVRCCARSHDPTAVSRVVDDLCGLYPIDANEATLVRSLEALLQCCSRHAPQFAKEALEVALFGARHDMPALVDIGLIYVAHADDVKQRSRIVAHYDRTRGCIVSTPCTDWHVPSYKALERIGRVVDEAYDDDNAEAFHAAMVHATDTCLAGYIRTRSAEHEGHRLCDDLIERETCCSLRSLDDPPFDCRCEVRSDKDGDDDGDGGERADP
jgi:hypothetical protein